MLIEDVEKLVEDYYKRVQITPAQQDALAGMLHHEFDRLMASETDELARLTANRDRLEGEQDRLMQAHYADAIPLTVLKREQNRITGKLDKVTRRIDAHYGDYAEARAHLDDALGLLANCADIYARCDDTNRRLGNQAFFTKVYIDEDSELRVKHNRPLEMLLDPQVNANALTWAADADKARTPTNIDVGKGSSLVRGVELRVCWFMTSFTSDESRHRSYPPRFHDGACPGNVSSCCRSSSRACPKLKRHASSR